MDGASVPDVLADKNKLEIIGQVDLAASVHVVEDIVSREKLVFPAGLPACDLGRQSLPE